MNTGVTGILQQIFRSIPDTDSVLRGFLTPTEALSVCGPTLEDNVTDRGEAYPEIETNDVGLDEEDIELRDVVLSNWNSIKSFYKCHRIVDVLNVRVWDPEDSEFSANPVNALASVWNSGKWRTKVNASVGCLLQHKETRQFRYFHSSSNNGTLFDQPVTVSSRQELLEFQQKMSDIDISDSAFRQRPNTQWRLYAVTNITFYMYKMSGVGRVGKGTSKCPKIIKDNPNVIGLYNSDKNRTSIH